MLLYGYTIRVTSCQCGFRNCTGGEARRSPTRPGYMEFRKPTETQFTENGFHTTVADYEQNLLDPSNNHMWELV